jgi:rhodanese-related sulfurtransferase
MHNLLLVILFSLGAASCANTPKKSETVVDQVKVPQVQALNQAELQDALLNKNVVLLDVRTPQEVASGYIKGTTHFIDVNSSSFSTEIQKLDKSKTYIVYCRSGARSSNASHYMVTNGFANVYNLTGGIMSYNGEIAK